MSPVIRSSLSLSCCIGGRRAGCPPRRTLCARLFSMRGTTFYVDEAALPFLWLLPLRNLDTCLFWEQEILYRLKGCLVSSSNSQYS